MKDAEPFCTCGYFQEEWLHHVECDLWDEIGFTMGDLKWDWRKSMLVVAPYDGFGRNDGCWELILETEGTPLCPDGNGRDMTISPDGHLEVIDVDEVLDDLEAWKRKPATESAPGEVTLEEYVSDEGPTDLRCFCWDEAKGTWCGPCGLTRAKVTDPWKENWTREHAVVKACECNPECGVFCAKSQSQRWTSNAKQWVYWNPSAVPNKNIQGSITPFVQKCRHYGKEIKFPDGTIIYASSLNNTKKEGEDVFPDLGIYMAGSWTPTSVAFHLGWTDFGLPTIPDEHVKWIIDYGLTRARSGDIVEIGCIGGHGRTGSVMAIMALSCGIPDPTEACEWVWKNYCSHAIEGDKQEWYVAKYSALLNGTEPPPMPVYTPKVATSTVVTSKPNTTTDLFSHTSGLGSEDLAPVSNNLLSSYGLNAGDWEDLMGLL